MAREISDRMAGAVRRWKEHHPNDQDVQLLRTATGLSTPVSYPLHRGVRVTRLSPEEFMETLSYEDEVTGWTPDENVADRFAGWDQRRGWRAIYHTEGPVQALPVDQWDRSRFSPEEKEHLVAGPLGVVRAVRGEYVNHVGATIPQVDVWVRRS